jgi:hypothetical protein
MRYSAMELSEVSKNLNNLLEQLEATELQARVLSRLSRQLVKSIQASNRGLLPKDVQTLQSLNSLLHSTLGMLSYSAQTMTSIGFWRLERSVVELESSST